MTPRLSPRELDVLRAAAEGLTVRATGHRLGISAHAVKRHRLHILAKLDVPTMLVAVAMAVGEGWIEGPRPAVRCAPNGYLPLVPVAAARLSS